MKKIIFSCFLTCSFFFKAQTFIQTYQDRVNQATQANINSYLTDFASYGVKRTGTTANTSALNWLKTKYLSFGYTSSQIVEDPFTFGSTSSKNLVVTKTGTLYPNTYVIICGHFDTVTGPGVNDNGSGVSVILEIARILKDVPTEYSIRFINFSGEEQGLYGSQHYVDNVVNATNPKMDIKLVFNIDQVGGIAGMTNDTIYCDVDQSSPVSNNAASQQVTQELANCTQLYTDLLTDFDPAYASDYIPFENNGEVITGFYEYHGPTNNYPHTTNDTYANMDPVYVLKVAKAAIGAAQHFAVATTSTLAVGETCTSTDIVRSLRIVPNPAKDFIMLDMLNANLKDFEFEIRDLSGTLLQTSKNSKRIDVSNIKPGIYIGTFTIEDQKTSKKLVIE